MSNYRHGDVYLFEVTEIPNGAKRTKVDGDVILAYGEVTGHAHRISQKTVSLWDDDGQRYLNVEGPAYLTHEEHHTIPLSKGVYRVVQQREYTPEAIRKVRD